MSEVPSSIRNRIIQLSIEGGMNAQEIAAHLSERHFECDEAYVAAVLELMGLVS